MNKSDIYKIRVALDHFEHLRDVLTFKVISGKEGGLPDGKSVKSHIQIPAFVLTIAFALAHRILGLKLDDQNAVRAVVGAMLLGDFFLFLVFAGAASQFAR